VNFNVNFNVLLSRYIVHPLVRIKKTLIIDNISHIRRVLGPVFVYIHF
jgi:hypothetical protein